MSNELTVVSNYNVVVLANEASPCDFSIHKRLHFPVTLRFI